MALAKLRTPVPVSPQPLFDLAPFEIEHKPSIDRMERAMTAAKDEAMDAAISVDARIFHLRRMRNYADVLIDQLQRGEPTP